MVLKKIFFSIIDLCLDTSCIYGEKTNPICLAIMDIATGHKISRLKSCSLRYLLKFTFIFSNEHLGILNGYLNRFLAVISLSFGTNTIVSMLVLDAF